MSMTAFEKQILTELREVTGLRNLKEKDMLEWQLGKGTKAQDGERVIYLPLTGTTVAIKKELGGK